MQKVDLAELRRLWEEANLSELASIHIVNKGYTHLANLTTAPDKPCFVVMERKEAMDWLAAAHNAIPALLDELEAARAENERLTDCIFQGEGIDAAGELGITRANFHEWVDARDRRQKLIGAAEAFDEMRLQADEVGKESGLSSKFCKLFADECIERAAKLRQEVGE